VRLGPSRACAARYFLVCRAVRRDPNGDPLLRFRSPSGLPPEGSCSTPLGASLLSWDFPAVRRIGSEGVHVPPELPTFRVKVRVQGFSPSSRFAPPSAARVYFAPLTSFGFPLQGVPLSGSHAGSSPSLCRRAVAPPVAHPPPRMARPAAHPSSTLGAEADAFGRLHGFAPPESPFLEQTLFASTRGRAPPGFYPRQGLPHRCDSGGSSPLAPPMRLTCGRSIELPRRYGHLPRSGVSLAPVVALPLSRLPSPPEVSGHLVLTMQRGLVRAHDFASGSRWRRRST